MADSPLKAGPTEPDRPLPMTGQAEPPETPPELVALRASIDNFDAALVHILAERFRCTQRVGELKAREGLPPADPAREQRQIERLNRLSEESGLDPQFAHAFMHFIVDEVIRHHERIAQAAEDHGTI